MKVLKNILSFILAIIITILICLIFATNLLNTTAFSKNYFLSKLNEADYRHHDSSKGHQRNTQYEQQHGQRARGKINFEARIAGVEKQVYY